ncbi:MAG TPA: N-acetyltransferase [Longimicrobium sp.]|nr:N-acetyltransferase [Longimicrobium sp.]
MLVQIAPPAADNLMELPPFDPSAPVYVRPANIADMLQVEPMINGFAAQNLMLPKTREQLVRLFREFVVAADEHGRVVGCGGLRVFSPTLAEVISLAVAPETQGLGLGGRIVDRLVEDAETLGITTVFALTLRDGFFHRLGFRTVPKEMFPAKVWSDCRNCPKLTACDEIAVVKEVHGMSGASHWE